MVVAAMWRSGGGVRLVGVEVTGPRGRCGSPFVPFSPPSPPATPPWPRAGKDEGIDVALMFFSQWHRLGLAGQGMKLGGTGERGGTTSGGCGSPVAPVFWLSRGEQLPTYRYLHVLSVCVSWKEVSVLVPRLTLLRPRTSPRVRQRACR